MHPTLCSLLLVLGYTVQERAPEPTAKDVVVSWIDAVNALARDDEEAVDAFVSLYREDALHITGPEAHQRGAVTFSGHDNIRNMALDLAERYDGLHYRIEVVTASETSKSLFHVADGPWGGPSVAVAYVAAFTRREDGVRFMVPGAAFFQIQEGKIRRVRQYVAAGEMAEVEPLK